MGKWILVVLAALVLLGGCEKKKGRRAERDLHYAAGYGSADDVRRLIARGAPVNGADGDGRTALHHAAREGREEAVRLLVRCGARVDSVDDSGRTPAMAAMSRDHRAIVEFLVAQGADVTLGMAVYLGNVDRVKSMIADGGDANAADELTSALRLAAGEGHLEIVQLLVGQGADINGRGSRGDTPLHQALRYAHTAVAEWLIVHGADVNSTSEYGETTLSYVAEHGQTTTVRLVLTYRADVNDPYALSLATSEGHKEIVEMLLDAGMDANVPIRYGWTALHAATSAGHEEIVDLLLTRGADVNAQGGKYEDYRTTPLHLAGRGAHGDIAALLLSHGADVNAKDSSGDTALHDVLENDPFTVGLWELIDYLGVEIPEDAQDPCGVGRRKDWQEQQMQVVKLLLDRGADVNATGTYGDTPLHTAARNGNKAAVELLIAYGASIEARNRGLAWPPEYDEHEAAGQTPLMMALRKGYLNTAEVLIGHGASVCAEDAMGETPLLIILDPAWMRTVPNKLQGSLGGYYGWYKEPLEFEAALRRAGRDMVRKLLARGAKANPRDQEGNTPLHGAAQFGDMELVELLLAHGADVEARDKIGATPLHYAARGHKGIAELLLKHGAPVNATCHDGDTPLHEAALRGHKEIVVVLLAHGADVNVKNSRGRTPLDTALLHDHVEIVRLLKEAQAAGRATQKQE